MSSPPSAPPSLLIFGGGSGIGFAAVELAVGRGLNVTVADLDPSTPERLATLAAPVGFLECDATDEADVHRAFDGAQRSWTRIDQVLTTIGGAELVDVPDLDVDTWQRELTFNVTSAYLVGRRALEVLCAQGSGSVVLTSSGQAVMSAPDRAAYAAAKAGVLSLTRSLAGSAASHGVRVNCVAPGPTDTPRFRDMNGGDDGVERVRLSMPMRRIPTPADCADVALYLLSEAARAVTGQTLHVNGGLLMP